MEKNLFQSFLRTTLIFFLIPMMILPKPILAMEFASEQTPQIFITEVQIAGKEKATDEFIELFNPGNSEIKLGGWRLSKKTKTGIEYNLVTKFPKEVILGARSFFLIAHNDFKGNVAPDLFYSTTQSLAEDNTLFLYSGESDDPIDLLGFGRAYEAKQNPAPNPGKGESLRRRLDENNNFSDLSDNSQDFQISQSPDPQNSAVNLDVIAEQENPDQENQKNQDISSEEVVPIKPESEVQNSEEQPRQIEETTPKNEESSTGALLENLIGAPQENIVMDEGVSEDLQDQEINDFSNDASSGAGALSVGQEDEIIASGIEKPAIKGRNLIFSEVLPNPDGADSQNEWLELFNQDNQEINLSQWKIKDLSGKSFNLPDVILEPGQYLVLIGEELRVSLNNNYEKLMLYRPDGTLADWLEYQNAKEEASFSRVADENWIWTSVPTPGGPNQVSEELLSGGELNSDIIEEDRVDQVIGQITAGSEVEDQGSGEAQQQEMSQKASSGPKIKYIIQKVYVKDTKSAKRQSSSAPKKQTKSAKTNKINSSQDKKKSKSSSLALPTENPPSPKENKSKSHKTIATSLLGSAGLLSYLVFRIFLKKP